MNYAEFAMVYDAYDDKACAVARKFFDTRFCTEEVYFEGDHIRVSYLDRDGDVENYLDVPAAWLDLDDVALDGIVNAEIEKRAHAAQLAYIEKQKKIQGERVAANLSRRKNLLAEIEKVDAQLKIWQGDSP